MSRMLKEASLILIAALLACNSSSSVDNRDETRKVSLPQPESVAQRRSTIMLTGIDSTSLAQDARVACIDVSTNAAACTSGELDVELSPDCGRAGFFGAVSRGEGAELHEVPVSAGNAIVARLGNEQFVCIQAIARREQDPEWYYVRAIPIATVMECAGNPLCAAYGDRPVEWTVSPTGQACAKDKAGQYSGDCPSGWLPAEAIEPFSEGI